MFEIGREAISVYREGQMKYWLSVLQLLSGGACSHSWLAAHKAPALNHAHTAPPESLIFLGGFRRGWVWTKQLEVV